MQRSLISLGFSLKMFAKNNSEKNKNIAPMEILY